MTRNILRLFPLLLCVLLISATACAVAEMVDDPELTTAVVDQAADLPDGSYTPDSFSFSGGTGRVKITCPEVQIQDGLAYATIQFSSSSYAYVKASGKILYPEIIDGKSVFTVPVALNRNNRILGLTTKMSSPHEIEYTIFISLSPAQEWVDALDEQAPEIPGFTAMEEIPCPNAENLKIFRYDQDALLFEVDTGMDGIAADASEDMTAADHQAALYRRRVLKYFASPQDTDIPAGLEKDVILISLPLNGVCTGSEWFAEFPNVCASMNHEQEGVPYAGSHEAPDYKTLLVSKTKLILADSSILPALRDTMCDRLAALGICAIVDCRTESTQEDWQLLYELLLNTEE